MSAIRSQLATAAIILVLGLPLRLTLAAANMAPSPRPLTDTELLAIMIQVVQRIDKCIRTKQFDLIHNEDAIIRIPYAELMKDSHAASFANFPEFRMALWQVVSNILALHTAADDSDEAALEQRFPNVVTAFARLKTFFPAKTVKAAEAMANRYTCPMHPDVVGKRAGRCPKCGMVLDQLVRIVPPTDGAAGRTVHATIRTPGPLAVGQRNDAYLRLTGADGSPITPADLIEVHTQKIHLLIVDPSLTDYHHEHPRPTTLPGEYYFAFTPRKPGTYRAWADVRPYPLGLQEYAVADIPGSGDAEELKETLTTRADVDGLRFDLLLTGSRVTAGKPTPARLRVRRADGSPCTDLEPVMATFAHLVGFNADRATVVHFHPKGPPVLDPAARGGPELEFLLYSAQPGFFRLFAQVQLAGESRVAPFGVKVLPPGR